MATSSQPGPQPASSSVIGYAFGTIHRWWMAKPLKAAAVAFLWYALVATAAGWLGVSSRHFPARSIECSTQTGSVNAAVSADGFYIWNWGILYFAAMPLAAFLMGQYFRSLENSLLKLDSVIKPVGGSAKPFTEFLAERVRLQWSAWIFPLSLCAPVILTLITDGRDLISPLRSGMILPTCTLDWSTVGYTVGHALPHWYLFFNVAAFLLQIFLGYCGILVLALSAGVLGVVFRYGLGDRQIVELFRAPGAMPAPERYKPDWQWCDARCGLKSLDVVFLQFVGLNLFALIASATSIFVNVFSRGRPTIGSFVLAIGTVLFIPFSCFWVFVPYFTKFPTKLPQGILASNECEEPNPWPFGSRDLSWVIISITALFWLSLFIIIVRSVFPNFRPR